MTKEAVFDDLIDTYSAYYNIKKEDVVSPFDAEAYFANEAEKYVLVKKAKIADVELQAFEELQIRTLRIQ